MTLGTILTVAVIAAAVGLVIRSMWKDWKSGASTCGGNCSTCGCHCHDK